ncbi:hypothetical protein LCGC14_1904500 [marine sediment metagenome]|uniref:Uncharacterized protein n=1 Tax=marine sediment metagenome TaxID=412755 RepID=A0A0F9GIV2_9ZZZZ
MMCELCGYITDDEYALRLHQLACNETPLTELGMVLEAEFILMEYHAQRQGCGCPRHLPWRVTS